MGVIVALVTPFIMDWLDRKRVVENRNNETQEKLRKVEEEREKFLLAMICELENIACFFLSESTLMNAAINVRRYGYRISSLFGEFSSSFFNNNIDKLDMEQIKQIICFKSNYASLLEELKNEFPKHTSTLQMKQTFRQFVLTMNDLSGAISSLDKSNKYALALSEIVKLPHGDDYSNHFKRITTKYKL